MWYHNSIISAKITYLLCCPKTTNLTRKKPLWSDQKLVDTCQTDDQSCTGNRRFRTSDVGLWYVKLSSQQPAVSPGVLGKTNRKTGMDGWHRTWAVAAPSEEVVDSVDAGLGIPKQVNEINRLMEVKVETHLWLHDLNGCCLWQTCCSVASITHLQVKLSLVDFVVLTWKNGSCLGFKYAQGFHFRGVDVSERLSQFVVLHFHLLYPQPIQNAGCIDVYRLMVCLLTYIALPVF